MFILCDQNRRLCGILCLLFLTLTLPFCLLMGVSGDGEIGENDIYFFWMMEKGENDGNTVVTYLCASPTLGDVCSDGAMAVLFTCRVADGWYLSSAEGVDEGENIHVMAEKGTFLLDGVLRPGEGNMRLARAEWKRIGGREFSFSLEWIQGEGNRLYVQGIDGAVRDYGFSVKNTVLFPVDTTFSNCASTRDTWEETPPTFQEDGKHSETGCPPNPSVSDFEENDSTEFVSVEFSESVFPEIIPSVYVGCQETPVRDGTYALRLLFWGDTYPFVYVEGGGALYGEITRPSCIDIWDGNIRTDFYPPEEKAWLVYTYQELFADREYVFLISTREGLFAVRYEQGMYRDTSRCEPSYFTKTK